MRLLHAKHVEWETVLCVMGISHQGLLSFFLSSILSPLANTNKHKQKITLVKGEYDAMSMFI